MKLVALTQENIENNEFLKKHLNDSPKYTKTITLTPNKDLWFKFKDIVEDAVGQNKMSRIITWITEYWIDYVTPENPPPDIEGEIYKTTLNVDQELWERYVDKIFNSFARYRMQTVIINDLIEKYIAEHYS